MTPSLDVAEPLLVLPARPTDARDFASHLVRHLAESGRDGREHFSPVVEVSRADVIHESERRWTTPLSVPGWGRTWLLWSRDPRVPSDVAPRVLGHVELRGPLVASALHRAELSIGIEATHVGRGHGKRLMAAAVAWARATAQLAHLDLRVFARNRPARRLYRDFGFVELGTVSEAFRMADGTSIDDVLMALRL